MSIDENALSPNLKLAIAAAKKASDIIKQAHQTKIKAQLKGNEGIVTEYDQRAERAIRLVLQAESAFAILGEESGLTGGEDDWLWVIDPIDGTTNFAHRIPFFVVSIALMYQAQFYLGVILNPSTGDCYYAERGKGAFKNGQPIQVSTVDNLGHSLVCISSGYPMEDKTRQAEIMRRLGGHCGLRRFGATALELCLVAEGVAEAFLCSGDSLWDYAAGAVILLEAGGRFSDWHAADQQGETAFICASNGRIHPHLLPHLRDLQVA